jgi:fibronectin-binding autotransporter adhesin
MKTNTCFAYHSNRGFGKFFFHSCAVALTAYALCFQALSAQDRRWTGAGGNANMGNAANWLEGSPAASTDYHFIFAPVNLASPFRLNPQSNVTGLGILSLSLAGNETYPGFTIAGSTPLTLKGNATATSGTHALNAPVSVSVDTTWNIASGAQVSFAGTDNITHASDRTLTKTGDGTLFLEGRQNNLAGTIQVDAGTLAAQNQGAFGTAALLLNSGTTLRLQRNDPSNFNANTTVAGNVTVTSARATTSGDGVNHALGTLAMGAHTMTVNSGDNGFLTGGTATITFGATTLSGNATFNVLNNVSGVTTRLRLGAVAGDGFGFTKTGAGELELTAAGTATGTVRIGAGSLILGNSLALASQTLDMDAGDTGTLGLGSLTAATIGVLTGSRGIVLENDSAAAVALTLGAVSAANVPSNYSGIFSGSGGVTKGGAQALTLTGNSTFTGQFNLNRGSVAVNRIGNAGEDAPLGRNGVVILGGASNNPRLAYEGAGETTDKQFQVGSGGAGAAGGGQIFNNGSGALVFNNAQFNAADTGATVNTERALTLGGNYTGGVNRIDGAIVDNNATNPVGVTVSAGTWQLGGNNTYTGNTTVSAGTLLINGSTTTSSTVTVASGATLGGSGTIGGAITVNSGGILSPGNSIGQLTVDTLTLQSGATMAFELTNNTSAGTTYDQIVGDSLIFADGGTFTITLIGIGDSISINDQFTLFTGSLSNFNPANITIVNNTSWTDGWQLSEGSLILTAVPEPATYAFIGGLLALGAVLIRRRMR